MLSWLVHRSSWSSTWGEDGYIYLEMAKNTCGLANDVTIPHVELGLSEAQVAEATVHREAMYQQAVLGL
jgi:C1A family cysteine protease